MTSCANAPPARVNELPTNVELWNRSLIFRPTAALTNSVTPCVQKACNAADVAQAAAAAVQICAQALSGSQTSAVASATGAGSNVTVPTSPTQTKNAAIANGVEALAAGAGVMAAFLF